MAAPKKNTEESTSLQSELDALKALVQQISVENAMLRNTGAGTSQPKVLIRNTGLMYVGFDLDGKDVLLQAKGPGSRMAIPYHVYENLKRETKYFDDGILVVEGDTSDNPNVIEDYEAFVAKLKEKEVESRIAAITSTGVLNRLWDVLIKEKDPSGKNLKMRKAVSKRMSEVGGFELVEDTNA